MSYDLYDENDWVAGGPTVQGLEALHLWAADKPVIKAFLDAGETGNVPGLLSALEGTRATGSTEISRQALIAACKQASGKLTLTDGLS